MGPQFGRMRLEAKFVALGVESGSLDKFDKMKLSPSKTFLLHRLVGNLKGSQVKFITFVAKLLFEQRRMEGSDIVIEILNVTFFLFFWIFSIMAPQVTTLFASVDKEGKIQDD